MPTDTFVRVPPNSTGEKIDVEQLTNGNGDAVDRQVVVIGDPSNHALEAGVTAAGVRVDASGATLPVNVDNWPVTQPISGTVTTAAPVQLVKFDYDVRTDSNPVYLGRAAPGTTDAATSWAVQKFTYDGSNRVTMIQTATGAWSNRGSLAYS